MKILSAFLLLTPFGAFAASDTAVVPDCCSYTLEQAFTAAEKQNPLLKAAQAQVDAQKAAMQVAFGKFLPDISAKASYTNAHNNPSTGLDSHTQPKRGELNLVQPLYTGGGNTAGYKAATARLEAANASLQNTQQQLKLLVVSAYMDVLRDESVYEEYGNLVKFLEQDLASTRTRLKLGDATKTDEQQALARAASARAQQSLALASVNSSRAALARLVGNGAEGLALTWPEKTAELPEWQDDTLAATQANHPEVLEKLSVLAAVRQGIDTARSGYFPDINAIASVVQTEDTTFSSGRTGDTQEGIVKVELTLPLFRGGQTLGAVRQAKALKTSAEEDYEQTRRLVAERLLSEKSAYEAALTSATAFAQALEAAKLATQGIEKENKAGSRSFLDVLDARQEELTAEVNLIRARRDVLVRTYGYLYALGKL